MKKENRAEGQKAPRDRGAKSPIAAARLSAGFTQGQLADAIGCRQEEMSRWERGVHAPRTDVLIKIAEALGCKIEDLI